MAPRHSLDQYNKLLAIIETTFDAERAEKLKAMYEFFKDRILVAPASGRIYYHCAYDGGYLDHIHNVIEASLQVTMLFKKMNTPIDYTKSELVFAAMHHDLGKLGDLEGPHFITETSEWHRKNQGKVYTMNPRIQFMTVPDRTFFLLQHFDVKYTWKELLGMRLADGMYDEANTRYLKTYNNDQKMETRLPYVLHIADYMSTISEKFQT